MAVEKPHKKLVAWQRTMDLVFAIYQTTKEFPKEEIYGLTSQMKRAAVSAPSNIAEGAAGRSNEQFKNYLNIAIGSLNELNTQIEIAFRVGFINQLKSDELQRLLDECLAVTYGLKRSLERK